MLCYGCRERVDIRELVDAGLVVLLQVVLARRLSRKKPPTVHIPLTIDVDKVIMGGRSGEADRKWVSLPMINDDETALRMPLCDLADEASKGRILPAEYVHFSMRGCAVPELTCRPICADPPPEASASQADHSFR